MAHIGLDICALNPDVKAHAARGIGRYVTALKSFYDKNPDQHVPITYFDSIQETKNSIFSPLVEILPAGRATVRQQLLYPLQLKRLKKDVRFLHFPAHMDAPSWSTISTIVTVLDLIPLIFADLYAPEQGNWRFKLARFLELRAIKNASLIIAISETTANDIVRLLHIPRSKIIVTPLGVDEKFYNASPNSIPEVKGLTYPNQKFFIYVGGIDPRKNIFLMLEAFSNLASRPQLVIAGKIQNEKNYQSLLAHIKKLSLEDSVVLPGFLPDEDIISLYQHASAFIFPSLYEGFGLPPLEALAAGALVLSSAASCMPEILKNAPLYFNPQSISEMAHAMEQALVMSPDERSRRVERGKEIAKMYPWEATAKATMDAYRHALEQLA